ncbi:DUF2141 domain-containing protein [Malonomonas rubra]|uniref:DUF2141 domain-containing protein n=1 Tax=Malonomonas rubra TaxID=57040 RepID=UPI0026F229B0|nr:DUF2141 domain-containing protein [Malonomonas rubra]
MICFLFAACSPVNAEPQQEGILRVAISSINTQAGGILRVALFRGESGWPKLKNAFELKQLPATAEQLELRFEKLPYADDYAIEVHHDENGNGKFDMRWLPYPRPKEGVGVSNNQFGFGHPDFIDARFSLSSPETTISIQMRY